MHKNSLKVIDLEKFNDNKFGLTNVNSNMLDNTDLSILNNSDFSIFNNKTNKYIDKITYISTNNCKKLNELGLKFPLINLVTKSSSGVYISVNFINGDFWETPVYTNLVEAVNLFNDFLLFLLQKTSSIVLTNVTIVINKGNCYVESKDAEPFSASGIYNSLSETPILNLNIGNPKVKINLFQIGGSGGSNIYGSCRLKIYNLCSLNPNESDLNRIIYKYPSIVFQNFIWTGSLWVDFEYSNLSGIDVIPNSLGFNNYYINGIPTNRIQPDDLYKYPWYKDNLVDTFLMTNVTILIPVGTQVSKNPNLFRIKPLFYFNGFSILQNQIWSNQIYSYCSANKTGNPPPLVYLNLSLTFGNLNTEFLLQNNKISAEVFGVYLPIALQLNNTNKIGIISCSFTGQVIANSQSLAISSCYILAIGTIDGQPLSETNPICKAIIFNNLLGDIVVRPGGVVTPPRLSMNSNEIVVNTYYPLTQESYLTYEDSLKNLPWTTLYKYPEVISKFNVQVFWSVPINNNFVYLKTYDAINLSNCSNAEVPIN
jgi:hypothetical protein